MTESDRRRRPSVVGVVVSVLSLLGSAALVSSCAASRSTAAAPAGDDAAWKITVAGDSISVGLGAELRSVAASAAGPRAVVKVIGEGGTGLARADRFDWPGRLRALAGSHPPDVVVFSVGSNDAQDLTDASGRVVVANADHAAWDGEYSRRLAEVFDAFEHTGTRVVWVGHVRTARPEVAVTNRRVQALAAAVASSRPWVAVRDLAELLHTGDVTATRCLAPDGLHLRVACLREADRALWPDLRART